MYVFNNILCCITFRKLVNADVWVFLTAERVMANLKSFPNLSTTKFFPPFGNSETLFFVLYCIHLFRSLSNKAISTFASENPHNLPAKKITVWMSELSVFHMIWLQVVCGLSNQHLWAHGEIQSPHDRPHSMTLGLKTFVKSIDRLNPVDGLERCSDPMPVRRADVGSFTQPIREWAAVVNAAVYVYLCELCLKLSSIQAQQTREEDNTWTVIQNLPKQISSSHQVNVSQCILFWRNETLF